MIGAISIQPAVADTSNALDETTAEVIETSVDTAVAMQDLGVDPTSFPVVPAGAETYFEQVADLALAQANSNLPQPTGSTASTSSTTCTPGQRSVYAANIAAVNSARDPYARTAAQETVYMYLSHYIDMSPSHVGDTCDYNSESQYYSAWITNDDRQAYDQFLGTIGVSNAVGAFANGIAAAKTLADAPGAISLLPKVRTVGDAADHLVTGAALVDASTTVLGAADDLIQIWQAGYTPEQAIALVDGAVGQPDLAANYQSMTIGIAAAGLSATLMGSVVGVGLAMVPVYVMFGQSLVNTAAWSGLLYSAQSRVPGRMMRYYGM
ncbi:hypothetical protein [Schumannella sp. 10F1B-5-1]|uniref:hypothetical protein n=1 Tax=Schumannella sp. 10F1B-5-1 TaxID=2590780 RepID=UPI001132254F|nr:hypothetical protein [Schumannella sp. 10F1B-5-1]TPW71073.1 hypothetical protein FJ658_13390 [Schumannella sp. 10F1B-5-1]